jgi:hypothetical protein
MIEKNYSWIFTFESSKRKLEFMVMTTGAHSQFLHKKAFVNFEA